MAYFELLRKYSLAGQADIVANIAYFVMNSTINCKNEAWAKSHNETPLLLLLWSVIELLYYRKRKLCVDIF